MGEANYLKALRYAALLCVIESSLMVVTLSLTFGWAESIDEVRLLALFVGAATIIRLLCNTPLTAFALLRAAAWLRRGSRGRIAVLNAAVYSGGLLSMFLPALVFGGIQVSQIPPAYFALIPACLISPFVLWFTSPFGEIRSIETHAA